jgi:hypothetical protein
VTDILFPLVLKEHVQETTDMLIEIEKWFTENTANEPFTRREALILLLGYKLGKSGIF